MGCRDTGFVLDSTSLAGGTEVMVHTRRQTVAPYNSSADNGQLAASTVQAGSKYGVGNNGVGDSGADPELPDSAPHPHAIVCSASK
eukprot:3907122-Rhodomonas_salina.2